MTEKMLSLINACYPLTQKDAGQFQTMKVSGMKFSVRAFDAAGLGHVSVMTAAGFLGLMRMDTLIITPEKIDMPLFSYDRVLAMGNDTLFCELYNTSEAMPALPAVAAVKQAHQALADHELGSHWYDPIKLPETLCKKGKKRHGEAFDTLAESYMAAYLSECGRAPVCDADAKRKLSAVYVDGLLSHGGPAADVFKKALGDETTAELFHRVLFATE